MSTFNNDLYIKESIESVLNQNYDNFEFIIIDDCSTDNTFEIVKSFQDKRIIYIKNKENKGLVTNLNKGIGISTGKYIARIDSDDYWVDKDKLKKQVDFLENNKEYGLVGTQAKAYDLNNNYLFSIKNPILDYKIRKVTLVKNPFIHSSVLYSKKVINECGKYNEKEKNVEDYGLWMRIGKKMKLANLNSFSVYYRLNKKGITQSNNLKQIKANILLIKKNRKNYPNYFLGILKWKLKELLVRCKLLKIINYFKK